MLSGIYVVVTDQKIGTTQAEEEEKNYEDLKNNFKNIFDNTVHKDLANELSNINYDTIIQTEYDIKEIQSGKYDLDIKIPKINIEDDNIKTINETIKNTYVPKIVDIATKSKAHTIFHISYVAYINNNILSLAIKSTLKDGTNPQRVIMQTFNINLENNQLLGVEDVITLKNLNKEDMQNKINQEISEIARQTELLGSEGYSIYTRNPNDEMYKIEKTDNFFLGQDGYLYIVYAYGNSNYTSEIDVVIF